MSNSVRPHRLPLTRLPRPWDSPGKNTELGCHFLLQCMKMKSESEVAQSSPTLRDPMDCSAPGSSIHGIFQARVLGWGAIAFSYSYTTISICSVISGYYSSTMADLSTHSTGSIAQYLLPNSLQEKFVHLSSRVHPSGLS